MQRLADHQAARQRKQQRRRVQQPRAEQKHAAIQVVANAPLPRGKSKQRSQQHTGRNRRAFEVTHLAAVAR